MKITPVPGYYDQWGVGFHFWCFHLKFYFKETVNVIYYKKQNKKKNKETWVSSALHHQVADAVNVLVAPVVPAHW